MRGECAGCGGRGRCRRITFVGRPPGIEQRAAQRLSGYRAAMAGLALEQNVATLDGLGMTIASGERAAEALLDRATHGLGFEVISRRSA
jgi:DNA-binding LacI/PurR family transcriptional regulator